MKKYLLDTCIWRDFFEDRINRHGKPFGSYASQLFVKIIKNKDIIIFSDLLIKELKIEYNEEEIINMFNLLFISGILKKVYTSDSDFSQAKTISKSMKIPLGDVLHTIIARNNKAIVISQDNHFQMLKHLAIIKKPQEIQ